MDVHDRARVHVHATAAYTTTLQNATNSQQQTNTQVITRLRKATPTDLLIPRSSRRQPHKCLPRAICT